MALKPGLKGRSSDIKAGVGNNFIVDSTSKHKKILMSTE